MSAATNRLLQAGIQDYQSGNFTKAHQLLAEIAESGNATAEFYLGDMYATGTGVSANGRRAARWFERSARQGNADAQVNLGSAYASGRGVHPDIGRALKWFRCSAAQGNALAEYNLGSAYAQGQGVVRNTATAMRLFLKAAIHGNSYALNNLGVAYATGEGQPPNPVMAYALFSAAIVADPGDRPAFNNRSKVLGALTPAERGGARLLASKFVEAGHFAYAYKRARAVVVALQAQRPRGFPALQGRPVTPSAHTGHRLRGFSAPVVI
ncbi:MAG TPA: tetratricopeptide repeat protein [Nevskiaceae bacterium]|nr:tetratricopeptide repeat protein [Nevskiaceae bacterium]